VAYLGSIRHAAKSGKIYHRQHRNQLSRRDHAKTLNLRWQNDSGIAAKWRSKQYSKKTTNVAA